MKNIEHQIQEIAAQIARLTEQKVHLESQLAQNAIAAENTFASNPQKISSEETTQLFKRYFRGRTDVYAKRWSSQSGKSGYSPACKHEWARDICGKPKIKCADCPNRTFLPFDDIAIKKHLTGTQILGLYPLLEDDSCYFLAMDFDGKSWREDVFAVKRTCVEANIPTAIERSRSGDGGHLWIFFTDKIPAITARRLGSFLITKTMSQRYQMDMKSYDRLFPNQDTLPKGGFGNLIALPFQKEAIANGNSVFIDDKAVPYPDQWGYLSSVRKMDAIEVNTIAESAAKAGAILDVRRSPIDEQDEPWNRLPPGKISPVVKIDNPPASIEAVLANRIYIKTEQCPSALLNRIKRLAAFQNPEFYKKQKMRFSTHATPRIICCSEIVDDYLSLPRGCIDDLRTVLKEHQIGLKLKDERKSGEATDFTFHGKLAVPQEQALQDVLSADFGVFVAPPGAGKTVLAIAAIAERKTNVLILTHRKPLMEQWRLQLSSLLGLDKKEIGQIGGGKNKSNGRVDIAMVQSLDSGQSVDPRIADYGFIIVDECQHVSAFSFEKALTQAKAKYVLGLTATPYRRDGQQPIIHMQCGPICHQMTRKDLPEQSSIATVCLHKTDFHCEWTENSKIHEVWNKMIADEKRNQLIVDDIIEAITAGRYPLILTERKEHLRTLEKLLDGKTDFLFVLYGGMREKTRQAIFQQIKAAPENARKAILATGSYIGEGFDEPALDTLFLTMPSSFKGKIVQYAGRLHRAHAGKQSIRIYDYADTTVSVLETMKKKRLKTYKLLGYVIEEISQIDTTHLSLFDAKA